MATLYEILADIEEAARNLVDEETGEINEEALERMEQLEIDREVKIENIALLIKNLRADASAIKAEKDSLDHRMKSLSNRADRIEAWLASILNGEAKSSPRYEIKWRKTDRVDITDEGAIPDEYLRVKAESKPDKALIKKAIKAGDKVPGAVLVEENKMRLN